ncbi:MAG: DUF2007 domain-containing protein [Litorimonas sp.]
MKCILTTNNPATLSFAEAILKEVGIDYFVLDQNMSVLEPGIMIPRRLMVVDEDESAARRQLGLAGMEKDLMEA